MHAIVKKYTQYSGDNNNRQIKRFAQKYIKP